MKCMPIKQMDLLLSLFSPSRPLCAREAILSKKFQMSSSATLL